MPKQTSDGPYKRRADEIGHDIRRLLLTLYTGAFATVLSTAVALAAQGISPAWTRVPLGIFLVGLVVLVLIYHFAKHKALIQDQADAAKRDIPSLDSFFLRNETYSLLVLLILLVGSVVGICNFSQISVHEKSISPTAAPAPVPR